MLNTKIIIALTASVCICGSIYMIKFKENKSNEVVILEQTEATEQLETTDMTDMVETTKPNDLEYKVYVCGCVNNPDVVTLKQGSRVIDAIELAGGVTDEADTNSINLAAFIVDSQKIYVPKVGETVDKNEFTEQNNDIEINNQNNNLININKADKSQLQSLPGIGETIAQYIIDYRTQNGDFKNVEDIKNVSKIGNKTFDKIKDRITVEN